MSTQGIERKARLIRELQRMAEEAQAEADALKDEIKAYMGDAETLTAGEYKITYKSVKSARLDCAALKRALPDIYASFSRPTESRRFCIA